MQASNNNQTSMNKLKHLQNINRLLITSIVLSAFILLTTFILLTKDGSVRSEVPSGSTLIYVFVFLSFVAYICLASFLILKNRQKYNTEYKQSLVMSELSKHFDVITYDWNRGFDKQQVELFGITEMGNVYRSEDYLKGVYNDITFEQADVIIDHETVVGNDRSVDVLFEGRVFIFDFPKSEVDRVQIHSRSFLHAPAMPAGIPVQSISIENKTFDDIFVVRAVSERDAHDLLTPVLMGRLLELQTHYPEVTICFAGGKIHIGIVSHGDAFDSPIDAKLTYSEEVANIRFDIQAITDIIDILTQNSIL